MPMAIPGKRLQLGDDSAAGILASQ